LLTAGDLTTTVIVRGKAEEDTHKRKMSRGEARQIEDKIGQEVNQVRSAEKITAFDDQKSGRFEPDRAECLRFGTMAKVIQSSVGREDA